MSDKKNFPQREKNILDHHQIKLKAELPGSDPKVTSTMAIRISGNNPRIIVYTNDPKEKDDYSRGMIQGEFGPLEFSMLLEHLKEIARDKTSRDVKYVIENSNYIFPGGKRSDQPVVKTRLIYGRDKDGVVYLILRDALKEKRPAIKFDLMPSKWHKFIKAGENKELIDKATLSTIATTGFINMLEKLMAIIYHKEYVPFVPKNSNKGGGQSSRNNNVSHEEDDFGDDMGDY